MPQPFSLPLRIAFCVASLAAFPPFGAAQRPPQNIARYKQLFNQPFDGVHAATEVLWKEIHPLPKGDIEQIIAALSADADINGADTGRVKLDLLKLHFSRINNGYYGNRFWRTMCPALLRQATLARNDYLLQSCCVLMGDAYLYHNNSDTAVFYLLKAASLLEPLGYKREVVQRHKIAASNALYRTQNYAECVAFCQSVDDLPTAAPLEVITAYNNTGLGYLKLSKPDSALYFFDKAARYAASVKWGVWEGIASGNIGDALYAQGRDAEAMRHWQGNGLPCSCKRCWRRTSRSNA